MKHVLVTAGVVYGRLDDNKLVGNRIRGIWATKFACWLGSRGYSVTLLLPDTFDKAALEQTMRETPPVVYVPDAPLPTFDVQYHTGYESYAERCYALAPKVDAAVMAAAVVNWIPADPIKGKMKTEGYAEGDVINIPFVLAPRVIDRMKKLNPKLTLIGCKMTSGADKTETLRQAYQTLLKSHANVVVANDLQRLKEKVLVYPDASARDMGSFGQFYEYLEATINDRFYRTERAQAAGSPAYSDPSEHDLNRAQVMFDNLCARYRERFKKWPTGPHGPERVYGAVAVRIDSDHVLVSPREKGEMFDSRDAVVVTEVNTARHVVFTMFGRKATLNAPLLVRVMGKFKANAVVHLHEQNPNWPTLPYAPPGTVRDNERKLETEAFNIEGHGCVFVERF